MALYGQQLQDYIAQGARVRGLDPAAVLAVASVEGGFGRPPTNVGDNNSSFGPFQLHRGGKLPGRVANPALWANTTAGLDYALEGIASVAAGQTGTQAITSIVHGFEQPKDEAAEVAKASARYSSYVSSLEPVVGRPSGSNPGPNSCPPSQIWVGEKGKCMPRCTILQTNEAGYLDGGKCVVPSGNSTPSPPSVAEQLLGPFGGLVDAISETLSFVASIRFVELLGGAFLLLAGLYLLGRQAGVDVPAPPFASRIPGV